MSLIKYILICGQKGTGKTCLATGLEAYLAVTSPGTRVRVYALADPIKYMMAQLLGCPAGEDPIAWVDARKQYKTAWSQGKTIRNMLQTLGTEWGQKCVDKLVWCRLLHNKIVDGYMYPETDVAIISDIRFEHEYSYFVNIADTEPLVIRANAYWRDENSATDSHASEDLEWSNLSGIVDIDIRSDDDIKRVYRAVAKLVRGEQP